MKKVLPLLVFATLLTACSAADNAPQEIVDYLSDCSFEKAYEAKTTLKEEFEMTISSLSDGTEQGGQTLLILYDRSDEDDFYYYRKAEYTGNQITLNGDVELYVTSKTMTLSYDADNAQYVRTTIYDGYTDEALTAAATKEGTPDYFRTDQIQDLKNEVFYSSNDSGLYTGGLYYADFFRQELSYYQYMSIDENNLFTYTLESLPYKTSTEQGLIDEVIKMDSDGMLVSETQRAQNYTSELESNLTVTVTYNEAIERI